MTEEEFLKFMNKKDPWAREILGKWNSEKNASHEKKNIDHLDEIKEKHELSLIDPYYNQLHLSPYSALMNDPNGLMHFNGEYHIFYQWSPFLPTHHVKKWGYYTTKDFLTFKHRGLALEIEDKTERNGIYSGGALVDGNLAYIYWTGNFKAQEEDEIDDSFIWVGKWDDYKIVDKHLLFKRDESKYTRHFRDPKVIKYGDFYFMFLGAQTHEKKGVVAVYRSDQPNKNFEWFSEIQINNFDTPDAYMFECPDVIFWNKKQASLLISTQGQNYKKDRYDLRMQPHVSIAVNGELIIDNENRNIIFNASNHQVLDYGYDFYAPQLFAPNNEEKLLLAWLGMPETEQKATFRNMWAHNLTLPRRIKYVNEKIYSYPVLNFGDNLSNIVLHEDKFELHKRQHFISFKFDSDNKNIDFKIELMNNEGEYFLIEFLRNIFYIHKAKMSYLHGENFKNLKSMPIKKIDTVELVIDNSVVEVFVNNGEFVLTSKYFVKTEKDEPLQVKFKNLRVNYYRELLPIKVEWDV